MRRSLELDPGQSHADSKLSPWRLDAQHISRPRAVSHEAQARYSDTLLAESKRGCEPVLLTQAPTGPRALIPRFNDGSMGEPGEGRRAAYEEKLIMFRLNAEWTDLLKQYKRDHSNPKNAACHKIGIPMIMASLPIGATIVGLPLAATLFTVGWGFQFLGHYYQGNSPAFFSDKRALAIGAIWWLQKAGIPIDETRRADAKSPSPVTEVHSNEDARGALRQRGDIDAKEGTVSRIDPSRLSHSWFLRLLEPRRRALLSRRARDVDAQLRRPRCARRHSRRQDLPYREPQAAREEGPRDHRLEQHRP